MITNSIRGYFLCGDIKKQNKQHRLSLELILSDYSENERHVIGDKLVDVTYHKTDWWKCFHPNIPDSVFDNAVHGWTWDHPQSSVADAMDELRTMSESRIRAYADYYNDLLLGF